MVAPAASIYFICTVICITLLTTVQSQLPTNNCERTAYPPDDRYKIPEYEINLDSAPLHRWAQIGKIYGPKLRNTVKDVEDLIRSIFGNTVYKIINQKLNKVAYSLPAPFYEEILGVATYSKLTLAQATLYNIFYEAFTFCTSIIVEANNGSLYHGRNLDTGLFLGWDKKNHTWRIAEKLKPLTVQLDWKKNGTTIYKSVNFAGYIGILTAVKEGKFTFSINKRFALNGGFMGLLEWIFFNDHKQSWTTFLSRDILESASTYEEAKERLASTRLLAPVYFILGGTKPGEGCVISRDRDNFNILSLNSSNVPSNSWYLVQTNYDHWKKAPFYDDRRTPAKYCLNTAGESTASPGLIYNILSTKPILNKETVYSALMDVNTGYIGGWTRDCPDPCWPW